MRPPSIRSRWLMQRRNVVFPEPDGPMMQTTSPRLTSSETPQSTRLRPKYFSTSSALTIGAPFVAHLAVVGRPRIRCAQPSSSARSLAPSFRSICTWISVQIVVSTRYQNATAMKYSTGLNVTE